MGGRYLRSPTRRSRKLDERRKLMGIAIAKCRLVNVTVENLAPCKKLLRVELEAGSVDEAFESTTREFQRHAAFPGFRPGKTPRDMVVKRYAHDIEQEVKKKLIPEAYRKAVKEKNLDVVGYPDIEEIQFHKGKPLQFAATVETAPDFELPDRSEERRVGKECRSRWSP